MSESADLSTRPGLILKAAREELGFSHEQVAESLHLRVSVVAAMEKEDYSEFSSDVFLKGYFRSYCRLVNLHEERMVELLENQLKSLQQEQDEIKAEEKKVAKAKSRKKLVLGAVAIIVVVSVAILLLNLFSDDADDLSFSAASLKEKLTNTSSQLSSSFESSSDETEVKPSTTETNDPLQTQARELARESDGNDSQIEDTDALGLGSLQEPKQEREVVKTEEQSVVALADEKLVSDNPAPALSEARVRISFSGDCWLKFVDGTGKTVFAALKKAEQDVSYLGPLPFSIVLGDARKAEVVFEGEPYDLTPFTRKNGRAQFVLQKQP